MAAAHRPEIAVGGVVVDDDALLLIRRATEPAAGRWSLPGGRVEWGETMAHALVRELLEETGIECVVGELIGWVERISDDHHFVIFDFAATPLSFDDPVAGDDALEVRWVPLDEVDQLDLVAGLGEFLAENDIIPTL
ncbi:MAG: NUDIX hydrolase [Acidimicrobiia bacterium]